MALFWHAVYNGYTTYFCTPENDADSFWEQQARDVMWGHSMGWFHPNILKRADKVALLRKLIDFRQANLDVLAYEWKCGLTGQRALLFVNLTSREQSVAFESDGVRKSLVLAPQTFKRL